MTFSPPPEAQHFCGNPLSPESPIPVHLPEPQNIPVLENQIDPIFNLMSTHLGNPVTQESHGMGMNTASTAVFEGIPQGQEPLDASRSAVRATVKLDRGSKSNGGENAASTAQEQHLLQEPNEPDKTQNILTSNAQPAVSINAYKSPSASAQNNLTPSAPSQSQNHAEATPEHYGLYRQVPEYATPREDTIMTALTTTGESDAPVQITSKDDNDEALNYQTLLDNITQSVPIPAAIESTITNTQALPADVPQPFSPGSAQPPLTTLPVPVGLPARPPPQEKPAIHPSYAYGDDIRAYHNPTTLSTNPLSTHNAHPSNPPRPTQSYPSQDGPASNGMAPPPLATFQQLPKNFNQPQRSPQTSQPPSRDNYGRNSNRLERSYLEEDSGHTRVPEKEKAFDEFLHDEANYTSQGQWERFPPGSRLFVGNLFTEKVSKRDLFYIFSRYGRLAQISMKSAYGFIQYIKAEDCHRAMQSEQGLQLRGRKINLEISKPQKNTRNAAAAIAQGNELRAAFSRRSRSPEYNRSSNMRGSSQRNGLDRMDQGSGYTNIRGRDDYRPMRSPSPKGSRMHDSYRGGRDRSPDRYHGGRRTRSRSPPNRGGSYRDRSPDSRDPDDDAALPMTRRPPGSAPDVQIILAEEVDRTFVGYIQQSFRDRSLRCEVLQLHRVSMTAVVKRQILEGVQAVVKIFRRSQVSGKVPLQVFNRSQGQNDVQFDEYEDLDAASAAEIVVRARATHVAPAQVQPQYSSHPSYAAPQYGQPPQLAFQNQNVSQQHVPPQQMPLQQSPAVGAPPNITNSVGSLDGPALQKLLASVSQSSQTPQNHQNLQAPPQQGQGSDLAAILSSVARQQAAQISQAQQGYPQTPQLGYPQQGLQQPGYPQQAPQQSGYPLYGGPPQQPYPQQNNQASNSNSNFQSNRPIQLGVQQPTQQQQPNVQEIMAQLARYGQR